MIALSERDFLARPRAMDLLYGALATWVYATAVLSITVGLAADAQEFGADWAAMIPALSVAGIGGALLVLAWGLPAGWILALALRRVTTPALHLGAYVLLGAVTGFGAGLLAVNLFSGHPLPPPGTTSVIVGLSTALGWITSWRRATRQPRIRRRPALPGPDAIALLAHPTWGDAWTGAVFTWLIITPSMAIAAAIVLTWGAPWTLWGVLLAPLLIMFFTGIVSGFVVLVVGVPGGMLLGRLLARVSAWPWHLAAYAALGALAAVGFALLDSLTTHSLFQSMTRGGGVVVLVTVTGLSVAAGWAIAWRRRVLRERLRLVFVAR